MLPSASQNGKKRKLSLERVLRGPEVGTTPSFELSLAPCWDPFWHQTVMVFRLSFRLRFWMDLLNEGVGVVSHLAPLWVVFLAICLNFAKNARPHENVVNSNQIEGRAPRKTTKKPSKTEEKTAGKRRRQLHASFVDFGSILGGCWSILTAKMHSKDE